MASTDAKAIPQKNVALRITFPIFDADGDLVTGATGLDSEVSKDGGTFADCTSEATEIATASGMYYLDLTSTEMNADTVAVIVKTTSSGAKTTPIVLYTAARSINDLAYPTVSGRSLDVTATGEAGVDLDNAAGTLDAAQFGTGALAAGVFGAGAITAASIAADAITAAKVADGTIDAATFAAGAINAGAIAADAIGASELAADAVTEIAAGVWDLATSGHTTAATFGAQVKTLMDTIAGYLDTEVAAILAAVDTEVAAIKAKTDLLTLAAIADAVWDEATAGHVAAGSTGLALTSGTPAAIVAAFLAETLPEPTAVYGWPAEVGDILAMLAAFQRNKMTQTATTTVLRNDADSAAIATRTVSDNGVTFISGEAT